MLLYKSWISFFFFKGLLTSHAVLASYYLHLEKPYFSSALALSLVLSVIFWKRRLQRKATLSEIHQLKVSSFVIVSFRNRFSPACRFAMLRYCLLFGTTYIGRSIKNLKSDSIFSIMKNMQNAFFSRFVVALLSLYS